MQLHHELDLKLEEFVRYPPWREADNGQTRRLAGLIAPIGGCTDAMLDRALENLDKIAVVGTTARFDETLILMSHVLGWSAPPTIYYPTNVERSRQPPDQLSVQMRDLILDRNRFDVRLYEEAKARLDSALEEHSDAIGGALQQFRLNMQRFRDELDEEARSFITALDEKDSD